MMSNILKATVTIQGTRPIFWCRFGPDAFPLEKQERTGVAGNDPEEWRRTVLMTKERQLYVEPSYIFATVRGGAKYIKKGRGSIQGSVAATLQVTDDRILMDRFVPEEPIPTDPDSLVYLDVRMVRNPTTKARNVRYRVACSAGWRSEFNLLWDRTVVSRSEMEGAVTDAGRLVGLADGRAIGFGRFEVLNFAASDA